MDVSKVDIEDLYVLQGTPVKVEVLPLTKAKDIYGNLYAVDPDTRNIVVAQFEEKNKESPSKLVFIPAYSIKLLHELGSVDDIPEASTSADNLIETLDKLFAKKPEESEPEEQVQARKKALLDHLTSQNVPFEETNGNIKIGPVFIEHPYTKKSMISENLVAIERTQKLLANVLK